MKENRFESITKRLQDRISGVSSRIESQYKNERPFGVNEVAPVDKLYIYDKLTPQEKTALMTAHGFAAWKAFEDDVNKIRASRGLQNG